ncbi:hypothetical protein [Mycolicibacterium insubricum]|uniref:Uncharacterized protein n=1 Tax=Mycolicibacterium insubricum TaxID=444597 RepID=A0A1X0CKM1_9MYCO|nr:hypothetical protein [Mycolicibacterium insubricum]MCV7080123.1 hypothetical protein [Mycolicibacterium insubricum]ORA60726.1 hypothetical protein BST26_21445 [Mycolicibacterium insubricum]
MSSPTDPLIPLRTAVVLLASLLIAAIAGRLTYLTSHDIPKALLAAGAAFGGGAVCLNTLIGR